jgi:chemotaxis-related protein WspB
MDLHGEPVPVIDLSRLAGLAPGQPWFDTRIILVDYPLGDGTTAGLGLLAEHVTGIEQLDAAALRAPGIDSAAFLGQVAGGQAGMLQLVRLEQLLTPQVRAMLFANRVQA